VGNEENEYLFPVTTTKKSLKEKVINELIEILMKKLQEMVKQNVEDEIKHHDIIKKLEKTQKQLNELREDLNKLQSEMKETIKKRNT
jgi:hypothetical protein